MTSGDPVVEALRAAGCVFAEAEAAVLRQSALDAAELQEMVSLRSTGTPLEYVVGWAEFAGIRILVDAGVFVPRPRSQALVAASIDRGGVSVLDLCCGTGAVGLAVARPLGAELLATDLDTVAVACARRNGVRALLGDLYEPLSKRRFDLVTLVAPYVPSGRLQLLPREARLFEPRAALDGGTDGLDVVRRAVADAPAWLNPGGWLLTEVSDEQAAEVAALMVAAGLTPEVEGGVVAGRYVEQRV